MCYVVCGQGLRYSPGQGNPLCCFVALSVGEGSEREQCCLLCSLLVFSHFPGYPQSNWALLVLISRWVGLCMILDPVGFSNELSCEAGSFSCHCLNPHKCFQSEVLRLYFPAVEPWVARSVSLPSCSSQFISMRMWDHPVCNPPPRRVRQPPWSSSHCLAASPFHLAPCLCSSYRSG